MSEPMLAFTRLPTGLVYHRGLLFDEANLEAVVKYVITNRAQCHHLTPQELSDRIWHWLAQQSAGYSPRRLEEMADRLDSVCGVYFTMSWNQLEGMSKEGVWCRGHLITFLARLGRPALQRVDARRAVGLFT